jgi:hypothetical protein
LICYPSANGEFKGEYLSYTLSLGSRNTCSATDAGFEVIDSVGENEWMTINNVPNAVKNLPYYPAFSTTNRFILLKRSYIDFKPSCRKEVKTMYESDKKVR